MKWKADLDALVQQTMRLVKNVPDEHAKYMPTLSVVEEVLIGASRSAGTFAPMVWPKSEREEIIERVASFKAHQQRTQHEREDYYTRTIAKARNLLASRRLDN
jgi:hypothetical protein